MAKKTGVKMLCYTSFMDQNRYFENNEEQLPVGLHGNAVSNAGT